VLRWVAPAPIMTKNSFCKITGCRHQWMLKAALDQKHGLVQQEVPKIEACRCLPTMIPREPLLLLAASAKFRVD
jgi:hypothetical protein